MNLKDFKFILYSTLFSFIVFGLIIPATQSKLFKLNPYVQFLIFTVGMFIFLNIFLKSVLEGEKLHIRESFGFLFFFLAAGINFPPFAVSTSGVLSNSGLLYGATSDYVLGSLYISLGLTGFVVYILTYIASPFIFFIIAAWLLKGLVKKI